MSIHIRNQIIQDTYNDGFSLGQIAREFDLTRERVRQIVVIDKSRSRFTRNSIEIKYRQKPRSIWKFLKKISVGDGCWEWTGLKSQLGYGRAPRFQGKYLYAHQMSYLIFNGPYPKSKQVLHICDNPGCVNPSHLYLGTPQDNMNDRDRKDRHGTAKFTREQVSKIRNEYTGEKGQISELATKYKVTAQTMSLLLRGLTYRDHQHKHHKEKTGED